MDEHEANCLQISVLPLACSHSEGCGIRGRSLGVAPGLWVRGWSHLQPQMARNLVIVPDSQFHCHPFLQHLSFIPSRAVVNVMKSFSLFCKLFIKFSSQLLKSGKSPELLVYIPLLLLFQTLDLSVHLVHSSEISILIHRTARMLSLACIIWHLQVLK